MKGVVFTELLDLVEAKFAYEMVDHIISDSDLPSGGAYTSIGTYEYNELVQLLAHLSRRTEIPVPELLKWLGQHMFGVFMKAYGHFFPQLDTAFALMSQFDQHIHSTIEKLYPDAKMPHFETIELTPQRLGMIYHSERKLADFAEGLMLACLAHFGEQGTIERENLQPDGSAVRFLIIKT